MMSYYVTSESVTEGHPDKICDQISDGILDAYLAVDPQARVAVETLVSGNTVVIAGEVTAGAQIDVARITRDIIRNIGYTDPQLGFDDQSCLIFTHLNSQSPDIALGVNRNNEAGGGDQGIMYGYACREAPGYMPLTCYLAHRLVMRMAQVRKEGLIPWLYPDGKAQVTMEYDDSGRPQSLLSLVISAHHEDVDMEYLRGELMTHVVEPVIDSRWIGRKTRIHINPTGRFVVGGPAGDTGLTGRKLMVDTYGSVGRHGGGAFSGKDATKVDRSAAYMARYAAKNIVAAGLADRCEICVAYVIGSPQPEAVYANTFHTETVPVDIINQILNETFSFAVSDMISQLQLCQPQFLATAAYGHFGREDKGFMWERTDRVDQIRDKAVGYLAKRLGQDGSPGMTEEGKHGND